MNVYTILIISIISSLLLQKIARKKMEWKANPGMKIYITKKNH